MYRAIDHGSWDEEELMVIRGFIGTIVSLSSNDKNGRLPGALCGDIATKWISTPRMRIGICTHPGASKYDKLNELSLYCNPPETFAKNSSGTWLITSFAQTGTWTSAWSSSSFGSISWSSIPQYGDFKLYVGSGYQPTFACKNLWIDTSVSV